MALKATIFKAELQIADTGRNYYQTHHLTLARHPSETDERMMLRLLAFALHAHAQLELTRGLSTSDEPDLWQRDLTGNIEVWIELGQPEPKTLRRACGRAAQVYVYNYGGNRAEIWWEQNRAELARNENLHVFNLPAAATAALAGLVQRNMALTVTIQGEEVAERCRYYRAPRGAMPQLVFSS